MKIELREITIREVVEGYVDNKEGGVVGYNGKLNIRPKYQREFVYGEKKRNAVVETIRSDFPLNVMYWAVNDDQTFEVLDGQQRTISFCKYIKDEFSVLFDGHPRLFSNLTIPERDQILNYKLMIYFCEGNDKEKLDWFKIVNIAGEKLTDQELRNAVYTGTWLTHSKSIFSKTNCSAHNISEHYVSGYPIRQEILQTALSWVSSGNIENYMSDHQHDPNANELWSYFQAVINWVKLTFTTQRKEMRNVNWGKLYDEYKDMMFDTNKLELKIKKLMTDDDVTRKSGVYEYVLTGKEKCLSIKAFTDTQKRSAYERQDGVCVKCEKKFELEAMEADHITPWSKGGKTIQENCQMLCCDCNRRKSDV